MPEETVYRYCPNKPRALLMTVFFFALYVFLLWMLITDQQVELQGVRHGPIVSRIFWAGLLLGFTWLLAFFVFPEAVWALRGGSRLVISTEAVGVPKKHRSSELVWVAYRDLRRLQLKRNAANTFCCGLDDSGRSLFALSALHFYSPRAFEEFVDQLESRTGLTASP